MTSLADWGARIARSATPITDIQNGPWLGAMESASSDLIPREYARGTDSTNFLYNPRTGRFKRRSGQTQKFDTFGSAVGMLPALWLSSATSTYCKARQMDEFLSPAVTDGAPTVCALVTKETVASGLDDGWFSNFWWRDQTGTANRTIGSEYGSTVYPVVGSDQPYKVVPLWYESGDGQITRGVSEFARRFFLSGSRRFIKNGNWWYFPNLKGTPARWNGTLATSSVTAGAYDLTAIDSWSPSGDYPWGDITGDAVPLLADVEDGSDLTGILMESIDTPTFYIIFNCATIPSNATHAIALRCIRSAGTTSGTFSVTVTDSAGVSYTSSEAISTWTDSVSLTTSHARSYTLTAGGTPTSTNTIRLALTGQSGTSPRFVIHNLSGTYGASSSSGAACRLIPSGPLPPTHAGTLASGNLISDESVSQTIRPDSDSSDGSWLNESGSATNLFESINENPASNTDYIQSTAASMTVCKIGLSDFGFTPASDSIVTMRFKASHLDAGAGGLTVKLLQASTQKAALAVLINPGAGETFSYTLTTAEKAAISDWTDLFLQFGTTGSSTRVRVYWADVAYTPPLNAAEGSWRGTDRFLYSVAYRFEDGSVWAPCTPRLPSPLLSTGFNMFTVNQGNPEGQYDFITWSNIPIGPHGTVGRLLLRTPKVDSSVTGDELKLNPFDLRVVWELTDNTTTTYVDYQADDFGLAEDSAGLFVRYDYIMPPRARHIAGGDMRVIHTYGGQNPCAILIAPVGRAADYDLNLLDTSSTAYSSQGSWMRYRIETDGNATLRLVQGDGATATNTLTLDMDDYLTLERLVDKINSTSFAVDGQQWRAQLCPGVNPSAPSKTCLAPHIREIASVVTTSSSTTLTKSSGGLSVVGVGAVITGTGITAGTYVQRIDSDTQLTMSAVATASGTVTLSFYNELGDVAITGELGWQRVISNALPGFLYFNESYLDDDPIDKSGVWMTTASPGSMRSAANNFSGKTANRFQPPVNAGISMGGGAVAQGFVLPFGDRVFALKNTRDSGTGIDEDYKLEELNANRGCVAWNTVATGPGFVAYLTPEGMCAADLDREYLLSEAIWNHAPATGSLSYEMPLCVAASAADDDTAYASARVLRSAIWLNYRTSTSTTHPNRQVVMDFSSGQESSGLSALFRKAGVAWGWSTPLVRSVTAMCEGRRADGGHLYGWNDLNAGTAGGRIDELETSDTDNGTAIAAEIRFPWERMGKHYKLSAQEIVVEHKAPSGATVLMDFHRSYSDATSTLTLSTTSADVGREVKMLPQAARVVTAACFIGYRQTAGGAAELRSFVLRAKSVPSYT